MVKYKVFMQDKVYPKARTFMKSFARKREAQKYLNKMEELRVGDTSEISKQIKLILI